MDSGSLRQSISSELFLLFLSWNSLLIYACGNTTINLHFRVYTNFHESEIWLVSKFQWIGYFNWRFASSRGDGWTFSSIRKIKLKNMAYFHNEPAQKYHCQKNITSCKRCGGYKVSLQIYLSRTVRYIRILTCFGNLDKRSWRTKRNWFRSSSLLIVYVPFSFVVRRSPPPPRWRDSEDRYLK